MPFHDNKYKSILLTKDELELLIYALKELDKDEGNEDLLIDLEDKLKEYGS